MKKLLLAAALLTATPAHAGLTDDYWVKKVGISIVADAMCNWRNDDLQARLLYEATRTTGASVQTVYAAGKTYALQILDYIEAEGGKTKFCRNIYNGKW